MTEYTNPFSERKHYYEHTEWIEEHIDSFFKDSQTTVFHEIATLDLHLDVYIIKPKNASFKILMTCGMSTLKMSVSEQVKNPKEVEFAELMMLIPDGIEFNETYTGKNKNDWIITMLKRTAKFPHYYNTWLEIGHSLQAEEDMTPYGSDTDFVGALILPSVTFDENFTVLKKDNKKINIYSVFPLYKSELEYKIEHGYNKFLDILIKANGNEVLDLNRTNLVQKKSFWNKIIRK